MKKRIFIAMQYLEIGGAERSLIGLLNAIDYGLYDVDLFLYQHTGEFMPLVPKGVNLLPERRGYNAINRPIATILKEGQIGVALARLWAKWQYARYARREHPREGSGIFQYIADCVAPFLPPLRHLGTYDLAISFLTPHNVVRDKVRARKKMAFIHTDYSTISVDTRKELPVWGAYDRIAAVSEGVQHAFLEAFPSLREKVCVIENILSPSCIREQAAQQDVSAEMPRTEGEWILCSVGRFCHAKNFDNVPHICRALADKGVRFKWYIVGYGGDEPLIRQRIREAGVERHCILLGKKETPYPYMAACDVYIQPSRYEGKAVTVREAQILRKPVIITRFATAEAQLENGVDGVIVPLPNEEAAEGIHQFLQNAPLRKQIIDHLTSHDYGNGSEIEKIVDNI